MSTNTVVTMQNTIYVLPDGATAKCSMSEFHLSNDSITAQDFCDGIAFESANIRVIANLWLKN